jgi:hypothetical protein
MRQMVRDVADVEGLAGSSGRTAGELGLGEDEAKSATKPLRVNPLNGVDIFE